MLFQIKRCSAPCVGRVDETGYRELVTETEDFLHGRTNHFGLVAQLRGFFGMLQERVHAAADQVARGFMPGEKHGDALGVELFLG